jgi:hypothetical protein
LTGHRLIAKGKSLFTSQNLKETKALEAEGRAMILCSLDQIFATGHDAETEHILDSQDRAVKEMGQIGDDGKD